MRIATLAISAFVLWVSAMAQALPAQFDLRNVQGKNYVSPIKKQSGGTCWTHGSMAALEGNLLLTGVWQSSGESGTADLAEYHLDWWNGFNQHYNADLDPKTGGLTVHQGGDYRVAAAYFARGDGAVRDEDGQSYNTPPKQFDSGYKTYYVNHIEWLSVGDNLESIDEVKQAIMDHGVIGTALTWSSSFYQSSSKTFYQPKTSSSDPNHAVAIVGWDDNKKTKASQPGAWLVKNSWGTSWGDKGYFWISYYDKVAGIHDEMGAVSFKGVEPLKYERIYSHDYHGWRDTKSGVTEAMNVFTAESAETLSAVSFYTAAKNVVYSIKIYGAFDGQKPSELLSIRDGMAAQIGFHTEELNWPVALSAGQKFYVAVELSHGGHPFDKTSNVPLLLGGGGRPIVESKSRPGQSFYLSQGTWKDLYSDDKSANFCIKGLTR